jgi:hypothetical protein
MGTKDRPDRPSRPKMRISPAKQKESLRTVFGRSLGV